MRIQLFSSFPPQKNILQKKVAWKIHCLVNSFRERYTRKSPKKSWGLIKKWGLRSYVNCKHFWPQVIFYIHILSESKKICTWLNWQAQSNRLAYYKNTHFNDARWSVYLRTWKELVKYCKYNIWSVLSQVLHSEFT